MKTALVTLSIGNVGSALLGWTQPYFIRYAKMLNADFHIVRMLPPGITYVHAGKLEAIKLLASYDRVVYIDADIVVSPRCNTSIFDVVPPSAIGMALCPMYENDIPRLKQSLDDLETRVTPLIEYKRYEYIYRHMNAGVLVLSQAHRNVLDITPLELQRLYNPKTFVYDQEIFNHILLSTNTPIHVLGPQWNFQRYMWTLENRFSMYMVHYITSAQSLLPLDIPVWNSLQNTSNNAVTVI